MSERRLALAGRVCYHCVCIGAAAAGPPVQIRQLIKERMLRLFTCTPGPAQTPSARCWTAAVCCFVLVLGGPALWGSTSPGAARSAQSGSEEESRSTNPNEIKGEVPRPRDEQLYRRFCDAGQKSSVRPRGSGARGKHLRHEVVTTEHALRNGLGAPLLC